MKNSSAQRELMRSTAIAAAMAATLASAAPAGAATLLDGSFESDGLTGWTATSLVSVVADDDGYAATDGQLFAALTAGLGTGVYTTLSQSFTIIGPATLEGDAAFLGHDYGPYDDDGFVRIFGGAVSTVLFSASVSTVGDYVSTPWTHFIAQLDAGTYTIEAGVRNNGDNNPIWSSHLLLDNITVTSPTPEPATWIMLVTGFLSLGALLRRRGSRFAAKIG